MSSKIKEQHNCIAFLVHIRLTVEFTFFNGKKKKRGFISLAADNNVQKDFYVIYGFAEDDAKTIAINSEAHIQPNRFFVWG